MNYQSVLEEIAREMGPHLEEGRVASYIPELARVSPRHFAMTVHTLEEGRFGCGESTRRFSIQSISKLFTLTLALRLEGPGLWRRLGREPSGSPFNSLVQLEREQGIPRNPFINAGALVVTDVILSHLHDATDCVLAFVRKLCGNEAVHYDDAVARSEESTGHRNAAMAYFLKSFGNLHNNPRAVLDAYFKHCALSMSCDDVAAACLFLANEGRLPAGGESIVTPQQAKFINSLLLTCGTYDAAGEFAYRVGLPAKSGVGGGIACAMPRRFAACVWSPGLGPSGNSHAGLLALESFTSRTGMSIF